MFEQLLLFFVSLLANTLSSLAGGGAGLLQFPALIFLGLPFGKALVTHKIATVALGLGASLKYFKHSSFQWQFIVIMLAGALPGVVLGAFTIVNVSSYFAMICLGLLTISLGIYSIFKPNLGKEDQIKNHTIKGYLIGAIGLFILGFLNGSLSSGSGLFVTIWLIYWFGMSYVRAVSYTMFLVGFFWNATGAITLVFLEAVQWSWVPVLLLGSLLGGYLGARIAMAKGNLLVKRCFEVMTIVTGFALLIKTI